MLALAAPVVEDDVRTAATKFVAADPVGSAVFSGRTVAGVRDADGLWIVSLSPSGHIIFSGSDLVDPIVGFSLTDFADPDPESSAFAMLDGARKTSLAAETSGAESRHAKWVKLLEKKSRFSLLANPVEPKSEAIIVPPFLQSQYNQWQPYNDYCPLYDSRLDTDVYRGRSPCGCVATAAMQVFRHFKWPVRIDQTLQYDHDFTGTNSVTTKFPIRFNGQVPFDWNRFDNAYADKGSSGFDLRGFVDESMRYPIARLALWTDVMAQMEFGADGSSANYNNIAAGVADWYTPGEWVKVEEGAERLREHMVAGVPCQVSLGHQVENEQRKGHQAVASGWAEDLSSDSQYVYLNFGFGGQNDGYYNIAESFQEYEEKEVYVGHYPRAKPQLEPLPKVCGPNITLNWHFPDFYNNNLSGFTVAVSKTATEPTTFLDNFSASEGISTSDGLYVGMDGTYGYDGKLLYAASNTVGTYTFNGSRTLTSASVLTFRLLSRFANWTTYEIQASFNDGEWETISTPALELATEVGNNQWQAPAPSWRTERLYLGSHGGQTVRFRVVKGKTSTSYFPAGRILLDDFQVTDVLEQEPTAVYDVLAPERNFELPMTLEAGASYSFTVTPEFTVAPEISGALVEGETSDPISVVVAGNQHVPIPSEQVYHLEDHSFSASDANGVWSYAYGQDGAVEGSSSVRAPWDCSITAILPGAITTDSSLSFQWSAYNYYVNASDTLSAVFINESGSETVIWSIPNSANTSDKQTVNLSLSNFAGQRGRIRIFYTHSGSAYASDGGVLYAPTITNIRVTEVAWDEVVRTDLGMPEILSVSNVVDGVAVLPVREDFFWDCRYGETNAFDVVCSEYVTNLMAYSSHLALVGDKQVTTSCIGPNTFRVFVDASGIGEAQLRSRMILTLEAIDENGTKAYKDLSLRFSAEDVAAPVFDPPSCLFYPTTNVAITCATQGATIRYTLDGTEPTESSMPYKGPIAIADDAVITAKAWADGMNPSAARSETYTYDATQGVPKGDFFADPIIISGASGTRVVKDNSAYTVEPDEPRHTPWDQYQTIWYEWTAPGSGPVEFVARFFNDQWGFSPMLAVYTGDSLSSITRITFDDDYDEDRVAIINFPATQGETYRIVGMAWNNEVSGTFKIEWSFLEVTTSVLPPATFNVPYNVTLEASGGVAPYAWSSPATTLPAGLSLSSNGILFGTPTASGVETVTVFVTDSAGARVGKTFNLEIKKKEVTPPLVESQEYTGGELTADISETGRYTVQNGGGIEAGDYSVTLTLKDDVNYRWAGGDSNPTSLTFTITKATNAWIVPPSIEGWMHGETPEGPNMGEAKFRSAGQLCCGV